MSVLLPHITPGGIMCFRDKCCIIFSWHSKQRGKIIYFQLQKAALGDHTGSALKSTKQLW